MHHYGSFVRLLMYNTNKNILTKKQEIKTKYGIDTKGVHELIEYTKLNINNLGLELIGVEKNSVVDPVLTDKYFLRMGDLENKGINNKNIENERVDHKDLENEGVNNKEICSSVNEGNLENENISTFNENISILEKSKENIFTTFIDKSNLSSIDTKLIITYSFILLENNKILFNKLTNLLNRINIFKNTDIENYLRFLKKDNFINFMKVDDEYEVVLGFRYFSDFGDIDILDFL
ncbi:hypothetical protein NAPIS_ORF02024 [Vairimorpha apis BRL 01]|uniref:Uncharacterized protein n=1 Tax=Vairimorpha apis BRL 01 TaxID=1037528 RepID=T0MH91_9MICR|nr:hypothetical protein NAPIS_ORF02024 [Vairimorpha apis BRL 01]